VKKKIHPSHWREQAGESSGRGKVLSQENCTGVHAIKSSAGEKSSCLPQHPSGTLCQDSRPWTRNKTGDFTKGKKKRSGERISTPTYRKKWKKKKEKKNLSRKKGVLTFSNFCKEGRASTTERRTEGGLRNLAGNARKKKRRYFFRRIHHIQSGKTGEKPPAEISQETNSPIAGTVTPFEKGRAM